MIRTISADQFASESPSRPTMYFLGVSTGQSSITKIFPKWIQYLRGHYEQLNDVELVGIDCPINAPSETYRQIVQCVKDNTTALGVLVTSHKINVLAASRDLFHQLGPHATSTKEVSSISKRDGKLLGHAFDISTSGLALANIVPADYWKKHAADVFVLGAGGSSRALTSHLNLSLPADDRPTRVIVSDRDASRLDAIQAIHELQPTGLEFVYLCAAENKDNSAVVSLLKPYSLVVNATGLGKDAVGSPLSSETKFPNNGIVWDFNYRGDLEFLRQANEQKQQRNLQIHDGWIYFLHGWTKVMSQILDIDIPSSGPIFEHLSQIARQQR